MTPVEPPDERATGVDLDAFRPGPPRVAGACIVVVYGAELGKRVVLAHAPLEIGRSSQSGLCVPQESVGRRHARVAWDGRRHVLMDLGSANGTFVNDELVARERALVDGDRIRIGRTILKYMSGDDIEAAYHEEIHRLATIDALTQVHNQRAWNEALERETNRAVRYRRPLSLVLFDLDRFERVNAAHGYAAGDGVLRQLALAIKPWLRKQDVFARVGGGAFGVLLPEIDVAGARVVADKIRKIVASSSFVVDRRPLSCTVSVGVATLGSTAPSPSSLFEAAAQKLCAAKDGGRDRVVG